MTDAEKRRIQLLKQTRQCNPPVHPRFQAINQKIFEEQSMEHSKHSSFGVRLIIAVLLFVLFVAMDYQGVETLSVDSKEITREIQRDLLENNIKR